MKNTNNKIIDSQKLSSILTNFLEKQPVWEQIIKLAKENTAGNIWLIGGAVSRTLTQELYGTPCANHDFDIVTDAPLKNPVIVPKGWTVSYEKFKNPTFTNGTTSVDLWPLSSSDHIKNNKLKPTIENLFNGVAFTIQAMAYDIQTKQVIGEKGIDALKNKCFSINNYENASKEAKRKGVTITERMTKKANSMGFSIIPPNS